ncbi:MAG TPA: hypothetical protein VJ303_00315, partial [Steroidobacteraceae bacterium]|nr:hypothetical protein [Steroidobacteraceae bacterium]
PQTTGEDGQLSTQDHGEEATRNISRQDRQDRQGQNSEIRKLRISEFFLAILAILARKFL